MSDRSLELTSIRELLSSVRFATMATVNADGSPHNSPFMFLHDDQFTHVYWGSHPGSQHSKNIVRTGQLFVVVYDSFEVKPGLYIQAGSGHALEGNELEAALAIHNAFRKRIGKKEIPYSYYIDTSPQRMWSAKIIHLWINAVERDGKGFLLKDYKIEIKREDLVG